jgi:hypothetical protein
MEPTPIANPSYGALEFLVRHGDWIAVVVALMPIAGGVAAWAAGMSVVFVPVGLVGSALAYLLMRSYVELVRVIVDMLLPK